MHPAFSVIVFTTASGAGYGLLVWSGLLSAFAVLPAERPVALGSLAAALVLITAGLLSSTIHLGHQERAWRALSQWRTSWLSREGVAALVTYLPAGLLALAWILTPEPGLWAVLLGLLTVPLALVTIYCTAMIYASLKPVHQWHNRFVVPNYFALSLYTGALILAAILRISGQPGTLVEVLTLLTGAAALAGKLAYWSFIDTTAGASTAESATGLGHLGRVRLFEAPHSEDNYLMREMGFKIARKHSRKLRLVVLAALFAAPLALTLLAILAGGAAATVLLVLAVLLAAPGLLAERWLFFAEAKHSVTLYYGAQAA